MLVNARSHRLRVAASVVADVGWNQLGLPSLLEPSLPGPLLGHTPHTSSLARVVTWCRQSHHIVHSHTLVACRRRPITAAKGARAGRCPTQAPPLPPPTSQTPWAGGRLLTEGGQSHGRSRRGTRGGTRRGRPPAGSCSGQRSQEVSAGAISCGVWGLGVEAVAQPGPAAKLVLGSGGPWQRDVPLPCCKTEQEAGLQLAAGTKQARPPRASNEPAGQPAPACTTKTPICTPPCHTHIPHNASYFQPQRSARRTLSEER